MNLLGWLKPAASAAPLLTPRAAIARYGNPGTGMTPDPAWVKAHIVTCRDEHGDHPSMPGVPARFYFQTHRLVEPAMRRAFAAAQAACPTYEIDRAASFVFRHQRHDPSRPLSLHSWGIATDIDADRNSARTFKGATPAPFSPLWRSIWPDGLPQAFVEAFEAEGFVWGGRWRGFVDPQHFQIAG